MNARFIEDPDGTIRIYRGRWKVALLLLVVAFFFVFGIWVAIVAPTVDVALTITFSYVGVPLSIIAGVFLLRRFFDRAPAFEIDSIGIVDRSTFTAFGCVRWDQIDFVVPYEKSGQPVLGIIPTYLQPFFDRQGVFKNSLVKLGLRVGSAPINIPQLMLPMKVAELANLLHKRYGVRVDI